MKLWSTDEVYGSCLLLPIGWSSPYLHGFKAFDSLQTGDSSIR